MNAPAKRIAGALERFRDALSLTPQGRGPAVLVIVLYALVTTALVLGRTARDALFLSAVPAAMPPRAYVLSAALSALAVLCVSALRRRMQAELTFPIVATLGGSAVFGLALLARSTHSVWAAWGAWVGMDVAAASLLVPFWDLLEPTFVARDHKRVLGLLGASELLVLVLAGLSTWAAAHVLAARDLLWPCAGLLWVSSVPVVLLALKRRTVHVSAPELSLGLKAERLRSIAALPHVSLLALVVTLAAVATTFADFQLKAAISARYGADAPAIARFASGFASLSGAIAILLAAAARPALFRRFGVVGVGIACAATTLLGAGCLLVVPAALWAAALARITHERMRLSATDSTLPPLLAPLPRQLRDDASAFIGKTIAPLAVLGAALLLLVLGATSRGPAIAMGGSSLLLVGALLRFRTEFARSRRYALRQHAMTHDTVPEQEALAVVPAALASRDVGQVQLGLELAPRVSADLSRAVAPLMDHEAPRVRQLAVDYVAERPHAELAESVRRKLDDPDAGVRASAIRALCIIEKGAAANEISLFLAASEVQVRAAAAAGLSSTEGAPGKPPGRGPS